MRKSPLLPLTCAALCLALCMILPILTGQIPTIGRQLSPMHLPVLLCGFVCGWKYGAAVGFIAPFLRFLLFQMPPILPSGIAMAFELAVYGTVTGLLYSLLPDRGRYLPPILLIAMLLGRIAGGAVQFLLLGFGLREEYSLSMFFTAYFASGVPGILVQLLLIPPLVLALRRAGLVRREKTAN